MIFLTVGPAAMQCGHWKSRNSMIVTGAFAGPVAGESPMGTENRFSSATADTEMSVTIMMKNSFLI